MKNSSKKVSSTLSKSRRSEIARKAAKAAWRTMHSAQYQKAAKRGTKAVQSFLANRRAA